MTIYKNKISLEQLKKKIRNMKMKHETRQISSEEKIIITDTTVLFRI